MPDTALPAPASLPTVEDVHAAAGRIAGHAVRTPLLESPLLNDRLGGRLLVKAEALQKTGSFKFRGAFNTVRQVADAGVKAVVAYSSGNHAQGVAAAARLCGVRATILMPADAPAIKLANTRAWGAEVVTYRRGREDREAIGARMAADRQAVLVKPYDDPRIIAGQGTVGLEIVEQASALGLVPDAVLVCCGGGGLASGTALAIRAGWPGVPVYAVEPDGYDDHVRSLAMGRRTGHQATAPTVCDALMSALPGEVTFALNQDLLAGAVTVSDDAVLGTMATAFETLKLVMEPGGAVAAAAVMAGRHPIGGRTVIAVNSGGNVDAAMFARALARGPLI